METHVTVWHHRFDPGASNKCAHRYRSDGTYCGRPGADHFHVGKPGPRGPYC